MATANTRLVTSGSAAAPQQLAALRLRRMPWTGIGALASTYAPWPLRLMAGGGLIYHGWPKVFDAAQRDGLASMLAGLGIPFSDGLALFVGLLEVVGGFCLLCGALTGLVAVLLMIEMLVAAVLVHAGNGFGALHMAGVGPDGPVFTRPGVELPLCYAAMLGALALMGAGPFSVDHWGELRAATRRSRAAPTAAAPTAAAPTAAAPAAATTTATTTATTATLAP